MRVKDDDTQQVYGQDGSITTASSGTQTQRNCDNPFDPLMCAAPVPSCLFGTCLIVPGILKNFCLFFCPDEPGGGGATPVYHRLESPTQTSEDAANQVASGEIWGKATVWGDEPVVKAYYGPLPPGAKGVEFTTDVPPTPTGHPGIAYWYASQKGVTVSGDYAKIPVTILKVTQ